MKYPKIIAELERTHWAITPEALLGIFKAVEFGLSVKDYGLFHKAASIPFLEDEDAPLSNVSIYKDKGILVLDGPIIPRGSEFSDISGYISLNKVTEAFKKFEANGDINEIVLVVDSPGGAVTGVSDFSNLISNSSKQVSVFVTGHAASAAYWISSGAHHIAAADSALVGSIGVVMAYRDYSKALEQRGIEDIEIVSSQSPDKRPDLKTEAGKAVIQKIVNDLADVFIEAVAENRDVSVETVESDFGQGSMLVADKALQAGMIDDVVSFDNFMEVKAQERGGRSEIRTLIFKKENFSTSKSAQEWAKKNKFKSEPIVEKENTWHITQKTDEYVRTRTGKPISPGVTPVYGILRRQGATTEAKQTKPAIAGERNAAMTLAEFLAENPAAKAELEAAKAEAFKAGKAELRSEVTRIAVLMECKGYNEKFREKAIMALKGEKSLEAIETLADFLDVKNEEENSQAAQEESAEQPEPQEIAAIEPQGEPQDGQLRTAADVEAWQMRMRSGNGEMEVA